MAINPRISGLTKHLLNREKAFILVNSGPDIVKMPWGGETIVVPGNRHVTPPHPKFTDVRHSAILAVDTGKGKTEDQLIPGTLIVKDLIHVGEFQETQRIWDVSNFIISLVGENLDGPYGLRGISWAPIDATLEEITQLAIEGRPRWEESRVGDAQLTVYEQGVKDARWMSYGIPPEPAKPYVGEARAFLAKMAEKRNTTLEALLMNKDPYARTMLSVDGNQAAVQAEYGGVKVGQSLIPPDEEAATVKPPAPQPASPTATKN